jgi:hypothetical protein
MLVANATIHPEQQGAYCGVAKGAETGIAELVDD